MTTSTTTSISTTNTNEWSTASPSNTTDHDSESFILLAMTEVTLTLPSNASGNDDCPVCNGVQTLSRDWFVLQLLFPLITLMANSLTHIAIYRARGMKSTIRMSFLNLSLTDILASLLYMYHIIFSWNALEFTIECVVRYSLYVTSIVLTLITILFMSADRFTSIFFPYAYEKINGRHYVSLVIGLTWVVSIGYTISGFSFMRPDPEGCVYALLLRPEIHLLYGVATCFNLTTIVVLNILVFGYTKIHISKIAATLVGDQKQEQISRLESKATMTTISVVVPFVFLNLPMAILHVYFYFDEPFTFTVEALHIINAVSSLSLGNSLINPIIYIWRSNLVRNELKKMGNQFVSLFQCGNSTCGVQKKPRSWDSGETPEAMQGTRHESL